MKPTSFVFTFRRDRRLFGSSVLFSPERKEQPSFIYFCIHGHRPNLFSISYFSTELAWLCKIELSSEEEIKDLLSEAAYKKFLEEAH